MKLLDPQSAEVGLGVKRLNGAKVRFPDAALDINFYFGHHADESELDPAFEPDLRSSDLLLLETTGWTTKGADLRQRLSDGDEEALQVFEEQAAAIPGQGGFWRKTNKAIFDSHVRIHYPDIPDGHRLAGQFRKILYEEVGLQQFIRSGVVDISRAPEQTLRTESSRRFEIYNKRERFILEHLFPKDLATKDRIKVVGFFGILHLNLAPLIARSAAKQGRSNITVSTNQTGEPLFSVAYNNFLNSRENTREDLVNFFSSEN